ncbi:uncharacterized protein LOC128734515 [Sabethes cyaneus]|uniref:uncharacterized protein LOC128734515 n=1 Tax=Sabethes cyaneus TaxID=53552 RepID=UPI00237EA45E|nr:uncharacterized protein LOC128734515 [Sabethes cyaneus]
MANAGNEQNEAFWAPDQRNHMSPQQQQQFVTPGGSSISGTSNNYFQPTADSSFNYGPPSNADNFTVLSDGFGNFIKVYHQTNEDVNLSNPSGKYDYELFSNNTNFVRPPPPFGYMFHQQHQQPTAPVTTTVPSENAASNTNLINQLVGNWAPTISGTYSPFGSGGASLLAEGLPRSSQETFLQANQSIQQLHQQQSLPEPQTAQNSPVHQPSQMMPSSVPTVNLPQPTSLPVASSTTTSTNINNYNQLNDDNSAKLNQNVNKKQRIVAEVKPMRMSYSDVLSKNVAQSAVLTATPSSTGTNNNFGNASTVTTKLMANSIASNKQNKCKKSQSTTNGQEDKFVRKLERNNGISSKKTTAGIQSGGSTNTQQSVENIGGNSKLSNATEKSTKRTDKPGAAKSSKGGNGQAFKKNRARNFNDSYTIQDVQNVSGKDTASVEQVGESSVNEEVQDENEDSVEYEDDSQSQLPQNSFMYNVKKTNNLNDTHIEKIGTSLRSSYKRGGRATGAGRTKMEKINQQTSSKRGQRPRKNQKYVIIQKIVNAWIEYTAIVLLWLWSLVTDVVYLSLRLCWDYLVAAYQYCQQHAVSLKKELQQNRPGTWLKGIWKSFDNRFSKESKWAFWRRGNKRSAPPDEQATSAKNYYKDGRLPSTADEAMSSLLNCKGKDAYSILGVSPECSQEQIRKHYKKIAVLVHPDKNKQPGAEEAFKVLQRSFELIGEPENRKAYDQSLAEALNAEKAWSEINDLLTQLHTKISEAANTIRCSSCCLRHPRKSTGRPHYAARECNSCKIRHSAREGDIWAETSFFGLRWKYLAMMEGNVYDITEWANCQKGALSHLQPNSHIVQYRIVLGGSQQQQQQQQQNQQQSQQHSSGQGQSHEKDSSRARKDASPSEPNLDDFLNNIYAGQNQQGQQQAQSNARRRHRRN